MGHPSKIPIVTAYRLSNRSMRGFAKHPQDIPMHEIEELTGDDGELVPVTKLRKYFSNAKAFKEFKNTIAVPDIHWVEAIEKNPDLKKYAKRFMTKRNYTPKSRIKVLSRLGSFSDSEVSDADSDVSLISINPSDDECDETDVNIPLPTCQAIRRVCRRYGPNRKYLPIPRDSSEDKKYHFRMSYRK